MRNEQELRDNFASNFENSTHIAYNELMRDEIIKRKDGQIPSYTINYSKSQKIRSPVNDETDETRADIIQPNIKDIKNLHYEFHDISSKSLPNKGVYYFYTKNDNSDFWITLIIPKPNVKPYKIILGSLKIKNLRISQIWHAVQKISKINNDGQFIRKCVENIEQKACGNNRLPSRSAFQIFMHLNLLKIVNKKGNVIFYKIVKINN